MTSPVTLPLWLFVLIVLFAAASFATNFLFPSVRWFFRRRMERAVERLNKRLETPIQPFKLARRYDLIQRILYDPQVNEAIVAHARENGLREDVSFEQARRYANEIVPSFSAFAYFGAGVRGARWLSNALFRVRLGHHEEEALKSIDPEATIVFVMNHRSNMDYVLVTYLAADRSALSYAVGEWARVWPLSRLIRAMGAFFIRRKSRNALYRKVLQRYVQLATAGGVTQAIFPEGGLSLDGGLQAPKMGLLKYLTEGLDLAARDVVFVPVGLNYDRVLEDQVLIKAQGAGGRRFDARISKVTLAVLRQLWLRVTGRFQKFGYAAVSFGTPFSLRAHRDLAEDPQALAEMLMSSIAAVVPVLAAPLVARLLLEGPKTRAELELGFTDYIKSHPGAHIPMPRGNRDYAVEVGVRGFLRRGLITLEADTYRIAPDATPVLEYYARSIEHLDAIFCTREITQSPES